MAIVTVNMVMSVLSARGSMILPTKVFMLYFLAMNPSSYSGLQIMRVAFEWECNNIVGRPHIHLKLLLLTISVKPATANIPSAKGYFSFTIRYPIYGEAKSLENVKIFGIV